MPSQPDEDFDDGKMTPNAEKGTVVLRVQRNRLEAILRLLVDSGDMTPQAKRQIMRVVEDDDFGFTMGDVVSPTGVEG